MNELQAKLDELEEQKAALYENDTVDPAQISQLNEQIKAVQAQMDQLSAQQADAQQLAQAKEEKLESLAQQISDYNIFGALFPDDFKEILGITEYEQKRQALNQILHAFATGIQSDTIDEYNDKLATANGQIRQLTVRAEDAESNLEQAQAKAAEEAEQFNAQLEQKDKELANLKEQLLMKQERIDELKEELEQAPAPSALRIDVTPKPNQSVADLINATREKSNSSIKSALQLALEGTSHRGRVILGSSGAPIATPDGGSETPQESFRDETATTGVENSGVLGAEATVTPPPFPEVSDNDNTVPEHQVDGGVAQEAGSVEERLQALEKRVAVLEGGLNTGAAA